MNAFIGPVAVGLWTPAFQWTSNPTNQGLRSASISLTAEWSAAKQLVELVDNPGRQVTISSETGVLEYVWFGDDLLRDASGWYLLKQASLSSQREHSLGGTKAVVPLSISALSLGARPVAVIHSARALTNSFSLSPSEVVAGPFAVSAGTPGFQVEPGGVALVREFDAAHGAGIFGRSVDARAMHLRVAAPGTIAELVVPTLEDDDKPASWISRRGGDCRVYDVSEGREVYGPSHPLAEPSDLILDNGLIRAWCGGRGIVPYLTIMAFADGAWHQCGCVALADETTGPQLDGARLVTVTPDQVTAALRVRTIGDVYVTLRRGERMLRVQHGATRAPTVAAVRRVTWLGTPPTTGGLAGATNGDGWFGEGLAVASAGLGFQWPAAATADAFSVREAWLPPDDDDTQASSGLFTVLDVDGAIAASAYFDDADGAVVFVVGDEELRTTALVFDADDPIVVAASFDTAHGMALTVATPTQTLVAIDAAAATPATGKRLDRLYLFGTADSVGFGELDFGEGGFGGEAFAASGVVDELQVFAGRLSAAQAAALVDPALQLDAVPFDPRPVWYAAFDTDLAPAMGALADGRRVESGPDEHGLTRVVAGLTAVASAGIGIGSPGSTVAIDFAAGVIAGDETGAALHDQFAAASTQETRIR